jgi:hypothetical protein
MGHFEQCNILLNKAVFKQFNPSKLDNAASSSKLDNAASSPLFMPGVHTGIIRSFKRLAVLGIHTEQSNQWT